MQPAGCVPHKLISLCLQGGAAGWPIGEDTLQGGQGNSSWRVWNVSPAMNQTTGLVLRHPARAQASQQGQGPVTGLRA